MTNFLVRVGLFSAAFTFLWIVLLIKLTIIPMGEIDVVQSGSIGGISSSSSNLSPGCEAVGIREPVDVYLTLSEPKTGTTALEWIAQHLLKFTSEEKQLCEAAAPAYSWSFSENPRLRKYTLKSPLGRATSFTAFGKHDSPFLELDRAGIEAVADACIAERIPAFSRNCLAKLPELPLSSMASWNFSFVAMFRDPIGAATSWVHYRHANITRDELNRKLSQNRVCEKFAARLALRYQLATEVLGTKGMLVQTLFFEDMVGNATEFVQGMARMLGIQPNGAIIHKTVQETTVEAMREIQQAIKENGESLLESKGGGGDQQQQHYPGLSAFGDNANKVRLGQAEEYKSELLPAVLTQCVEQAFFHLPEALARRYILKNSSAASALEGQ